MCKAPKAGASKTRLTPPLSGEEAAVLSGCFIADVAAVIAGLPAALAARGLPAPLAARRLAVFTPAGAEAAFEGLLPAGFSLLAQRGDSLEARLIAAARDLFDSGHGAVCLLNSDSPTLPGAVLEAAAAALARPGDRLVLGPALDGGYYLIGLKQAHAQVFRHISWSTPYVFQQTVRAAATLRLPVTRLPPWYDVDDLAGLHLLLDELFGAGAPPAVGGVKGAPACRSRQYLRQLLDSPDAARLGFSSPRRGG